MQYQGKNLLNETDTFQFHCKRCGLCCINREDVMLSAYDIWRIGRYLKKTPSEVVKEYGEVYVGADSKLPCIRVLPKGKNKVCPFLANNKCKIQEVKPTACALYPLGRVFCVDSPEIGYLKQDVTCGTADCTYTVKEWLDLAGIDYHATECAKIWSEVLMATVPFVQHIQIFDCLNKIYSALLNAMYLDYDCNNAFYPQITQRKLELIKMYENLGCIEEKK